MTEITKQSFFPKKETILRWLKPRKYKLKEEFHILDKDQGLHWLGTLGMNIVQSCFLLLFVGKLKCFLPFHLVLFFRLAVWLGVHLCNDGVGKRGGKCDIFSSLFFQMEQSTGWIKSFENYSNKFIQQIYEVHDMIIKCDIFSSLFFQMEQSTGWIKTFVRFKITITQAKKVLNMKIWFNFAQIWFYL